MYEFDNIKGLVDKGFKVIKRKQGMFILKKNDLYIVRYKDREFNRITKNKEFINQLIGV